jgi:hypothetical protein
MFEESREYIFVRLFAGKQGTYISILVPDFRVYKGQILTPVDPLRIRRRL